MSREHRRRDLSRWPRGTLYKQKLALTSLTSGGRSVGSSQGVIIIKLCMNIDKSNYMN
jgi:hypothetical protein